MQARKQTNKKGSTLALKPRGQTSPEIQSRGISDPTERTRVVQNFFKKVPYSSFTIFPNFLPNHGRILPASTYNGLQSLNVNAGIILAGFGRKLRNIRKLDCDILRSSTRVNSKRVYFCTNMLQKYVFPCAHGIISSLITEKKNGRHNRGFHDMQI